MFDRLAKRLEKEILLKVPHAAEINVVAPRERKFASWIGGSILASSTAVQEMWISKDEYEEFGSSIVHRKCFL